MLCDKKNVISAMFMVKDYFDITPRLSNILNKLCSKLQLFNTKSVTDMYIRLITVTWIELFQINTIFMEYSKQFQIFMF
jgi:hypothetical protein